MLSYSWRATIAAVLLASGVQAAVQILATKGVLDGAAYTANIPAGGIFVVKGNELSPPGYMAATLPLTTTLNGSQVTLISGGTRILCYMVYTYNLGGVNQLAALVPSATAPGDYTVTVTAAGATSNAVKTKVVQRKFGLITVAGDGTGMAVVQNYISASQLDLNRFSTGRIGDYTTSPLTPGGTGIAWGIGLGPLRNRLDSTAPGAVDMRGEATVQVQVGNKTITPFYAGRAPQFPGADQVNFTLPDDVQTGCAVPFLVRVNGVYSNLTTIAIAPAGKDTCEHPFLVSEILRRLDQGGTFVSGDFSLTHSEVQMSVSGINMEMKSEDIAGGFMKFSLAGLSGDTSAMGITMIGDCWVYQMPITPFDPTDTEPIRMPDFLHAGDALTLTGPNLNNVAVPAGKGALGDFLNYYSASLYSATTGLPIPNPTPSPNPNPVIAGGVYTLTFPGGRDIGAGTASVRVSAPFVWTNRAAIQTVNRNAPLVVAWTGGSSEDLVSVSGMSMGESAIGIFSCTARGNAGSLTVPVAVLQQMLPTPAGQSANLATLGVGLSNGENNGRFTLPLRSGGNIDYGIFGFGMSYMKSVTFQ